jgi:hypothetical protein
MNPGLLHPKGVLALAYNLSSTVVKHQPNQALYSKSKNSSDPQNSKQSSMCSADT